MIRVLIRFSEAIPDHLLVLLEESGQVEIINSTDACDIILIYTSSWNPASLNRVQQWIHQATKPTVIICEQGQNGFNLDSVLRHNIFGVLMLHDGQKKIVSALRAAAAGWKVMQPSLPTNHHPSQLPSLTPREMEILRLIADGEGNKSIAYLLEISEHTVKFHISSIFEKLHVSSRTEAVKAGITLGLISI